MNMSQTIKTIKTFLPVLFFVFGTDAIYAASFGGESWLPPVPTAPRTNSQTHTGRNKKEPSIRAANPSQKDVPKAKVTYEKDSVLPALRWEA